MKVWECMRTSLRHSLTERDHYDKHVEKGPGVNGIARRFDGHHQWYSIDRYLLWFV